jgi:hypothetical protein
MKQRLHAVLAHVRPDSERVRAARKKLERTSGGMWVLALAAVVAIAAAGGSAGAAGEDQTASAYPSPASPNIVVTQAVHDVSASLEGMTPETNGVDPCEADADAVGCEDEEDEEAGGGLGADDSDADSDGDPGSGASETPLTAASVEQTSFGPRPAIPTVASFDNGLNGGSTSDNHIAPGPNSIAVIRNSQFKIMTKTGDTIFGPVNSNSIFSGTNEVQPVALTGFTTDGNSYTLNYNGDTSVPITRGQNNTQAGIQAAIQGGNEQQQVALTGFTGTNSYTLNYNGVDSAPFVRGTNHTAAALLAALNGPSEVQTVSLADYDTNGDSYRLSFNGNQTVPIVRGQNDTAAGIATAIQGGNEIQTVTFSNFNAANPGNTFRIKIGDRVSGPIGFATALGDAATATSQNTSDEINAIFGFKGTVTVAGVNSTTGPTITFAGASAGTDVPPVEIVFGDCATAPTPCTYTNRETAKGGLAMAGWPTNGTAATVAAGAVTDAGYTLTFGGGGLQGTDVSDFSVTSGSGASGTVAETVKGAQGLLPVGTVATVGAVADTGYTITFGGAVTRTDVAPLSVTNATGGTTGTVRETVKGTAGFAGWIPETTVTIGTVADTGYNVTFNALTPLGSVRQTGLGDVSQLTVTNGTGGTDGTATTTTQGKPGIGQGACTNSGDGHIRYDQFAHRWLFTIPAFQRVGGLYAMCQAVSIGDDPVGPYYRYVFRRSLFPDYPRVAIWRDGYYNATSTGDNVIEKHACVTDRTNMLAGLDATEQCIIVPAVSFMEPASIEGQALPPAGAPEHFFAAGGYQLRSIFEDDGIYTYKFHVDWANPLSSTFTGPQKITVAPYHFLCNGQLTQCVPQPNSTTRLDAQGDKIMHGVVYRKVNGVESMVMLHSINTEVGAGGERWYEMRLDANRDPFLYQQSTYAPDNHYRWMGSPNIDRKGDIALAYSFGGGPYVLPIATTLSAASAVGATNIKVAAVTGTNVNFAVGGQINIGTGATLETATVAAVGTAGAAGTGIDLTAPLTIAHPSGASSPVSNAAFVCTPPVCLPVGQRYTARQPDDPLGTMTYQDGVIVDGIGAAGGSRWEDWSKLAIDPTDDCTFWYFGGYGQPGRTGGPYFGRVGAFRVPTCRLDATGAAPPWIHSRTFSGPAATFTDSDLTATADVFTASIDWGDGTMSAGTVTGGGGSFSVAGAHTYAADGVFTVTTSITGTEGSIASAESTLGVDTVAPEASFQIDVHSDSLDVFGTDELSGVAGGPFEPVSSVRTKWRWKHDPDKVRRSRHPDALALTYLIADRAGNTITVVVKVKDERRSDHDDYDDRNSRHGDADDDDRGSSDNDLEFRIVSLRYNDGPSIKAAENLGKFDWRFERKTHAIRELDQTLEVKTAQGRFEIEAEYDSRKNTTKITVERPGHDTKVTLPGRILLRLVTLEGGLSFEF